MLREFTQIKDKIVLESFQKFQNGLIFDVLRLINVKYAHNCAAFFMSYCDKKSYYKVNIEF